MSHQQVPDKLRRTGPQGRSSLSALEPIDSSPFRNPSSAWFVWSTIGLTWLISLPPWRLWQPSPDLLLLVIVFWCLNEPRRVGLLTAFAMGLLMDVHDAGLLGAHALVFTLVAYSAMALRRRLLQFGAVVQMLHLLPFFVGAQALGQIILSWLAGEWAGWNWFWSTLFTVALWPLVDIILHLPQRRLEDIDAAGG